MLLLLMGLLILSTNTRKEGSFRMSTRVSDSYTDESLESARVSVLMNNQIVASGDTDAEGNVVLEIPPLTDDKEDPLPSTFSLSENYPNPFYDDTRVNIDITDAQTIRADIYNILGQRVGYRDMALESGTYALNLSLGSLSTGMYFLVVHGTGTQTVKMSKSGGSISQSPPRFSIEPAMGETPGEMEPDDEVFLTLRVEKDRYESREIHTAISTDTSITLGLDRLNEVAFVVEDEKDQTRAGDLQLIAPYINLTVAAPDTILLKSGIYDVKAQMDFSTPIDETVEITSVDTVFSLSVETVRAMTTVNEDPESDLLFLFDHIDGHTGYFYGIHSGPGNANQKMAGNEESDLMKATHMTFTWNDGTVTVIIFNEDYYPISWSDEEYVISARRLDDEPFDPGNAPHSFFYEEREDTATINIKPGNLYALIDWLENETGDTFPDARQFLDDHAAHFEEIQLLARTAGRDQDQYIKAAASFTMIAAVRAFHELAEVQKKPVHELAEIQERPVHERMAGEENQIRTSFDFNPQPHSPSFVVFGPIGLAQAMLGAAFGAAVDRSAIDRSGPTVRIYVCRGATSWPGICQETVHTGRSVSPCMSTCPVTIQCFVDICIPDVMNVEQALKTRSRH